MRSKKILSETIENIEIIKGIIIGGITSLNFTLGDIDIEEDLEDISHLKPVLTMEFGNMYKFKMQLYKRSSFDSTSFDYMISVESDDLKGIEDKPQHYGSFHIDSYNIADTDETIKNDINEFIISYTQSKQNELFIKLNEEFTEEEKKSNTEFILYVKNFIEAELNKNNINYNLNIVTDPENIFEDRNTKLFFYEINTEYGSFVIKVNCFTPLNGELNTIRIKLWYDKNGFATSMEVYKGFDVDYSNVFDQRIIKTMQKILLPNTTKYILKMNEYMDYKDIMLNDKNFLDKEDQLIKMYRDQIKDYDQKKNILKDTFEDVEEEIDSVSVYRTVEENIFLKQYITLLTKLREKLILEKSLEQKQEVLDALKSESDLTENQKELSEKEKEIIDIENRLRKLSNLDIMFNKWEANMSKIERDLKNGKPLSISMLDIV